jgi:hypothetical protein
MHDGNSGATALLGMDGFVVLASIEEAGELFISVETTADVVGCAGTTPSTPAERAPLFPLTRLHATTRNAGSQTRL